MAVVRITKEELKDRIESADEKTRPVLVDARLRYPYEHSTMKLPGAVRLSPGDVVPATLPKGRDIVVYDSDPDEITASAAAVGLIKAGFRAVVLRGGLPEWVGANLPVDTKDAVRPAPVAAPAAKE